MANVRNIKEARPAPQEAAVADNANAPSIDAGAIKLQSKAEIGKRVQSALKSLDTTRDAVHAASVQTLLHAATHGDYSLFETLLKGLIANGFSNVKGLRFAVERYTPLTIKLDGKSIAITYHRPASLRGQRLIAANGSLWAIELFQNNPFWTLEAVKADQTRNVRAVTVMSMLDSINRTAQAAIEAFNAGTIDRLELDKVAKLAAGFEEVARKQGLENQFKASRQKAVDQADAKRDKVAIAA